jgi:hypothetical protein
VAEAVAKVVAVDQRVVPRRVVELEEEEWLVDH